MMAFSGAQLSIDFTSRSHARRGDPETSHEAAGRVREFAAGQCAAILAVLREKGPLGAEQIAAYLNIEPYSTRKRLADLEHAGKAQPLPMQRVTASGRHERIWRAW
jgi:Mn-dependent DtxR family transcriptional regulator